MVRFTIAILALIVTILALVARHGTLRDLKIANESLRRKMVAEPPSAVAPPGNPPADAPGLNAAERAELLRLRGQIRPLHQELRDLSNHIEHAAALASPAQTPTAQANTERLQISQPRQSQKQVMEAFVRSEPVRSLYRKGALAGQKIQNYLRENNHELPQDLAVLNGLPEGFELMRSGLVSQDEGGRTLVARQKEPLQTPDGRMMRVYVRANGTLVVGTLPANGDWAAWEQRGEEGP
jgi:hypothetical protein